MPLLLTSSRLAPFSIKNFANSTFPLKLTPINAVLPEASLSFIGALCFIKVLVAASLSKYVAKINGVNPRWSLASANFGFSVKSVFNVALSLFLILLNTLSMLSIFLVFF